MKTQLEQWLEAERLSAEENKMSEKPDEFEFGYYAAIVNCLDFLQGREVFIDWQQRQREKEETK